jgi:hypothetical protein
MIALIEESADAWHSGNARRCLTVTFLHEGFQPGPFTWGFEIGCVGPTGSGLGLLARNQSSRIETGECSNPFPFSFFS